MAKSELSYTAEKPHAGSVCREEDADNFISVVY